MRVEILKLFYLLKLTNKRALKLCWDSQKLNSPGRNISSSRRLRVWPEILNAVVLPCKFSPLFQTVLKLLCYLLFYQNWVSQFLIKLFQLICMTLVYYKNLKNQTWAKALSHLTKKCLECKWWNASEWMHSFIIIEKVSFSKMCHIIPILKQNQNGILSIHLLQNPAKKDDGELFFHNVHQLIMTIIIQRIVFSIFLSLS